VRVQDVDVGEIFDIGNVKRNTAYRVGGRPEEERDLVDEDAELAGFGGEECVECVGVVFGCVEGASDSTV
jgi:hypothetical protein